MPLILLCIIWDVIVQSVIDKLCSTYSVFFSCQILLGQTSPYAHSPKQFQSCGSVQSVVLFSPYIDTVRERPQREYLARVMTDDLLVVVFAVVCSWFKWMPRHRSSWVITNSRAAYKTPHRSHSPQSDCIVHRLSVPSSFRSSLSALWRVQSNTIHLSIGLVRHNLRNLASTVVIRTATDTYDVHARVIPIDTLPVTFYNPYITIWYRIDH